MAFDWRTVLELARFLQEQIPAGASGFAEAAYRCAFGRAYYAAFGHAHQFARAWLGYRPKAHWEDKSQEHGALRAFLKSRRRAKVADKLELLRSWRNLCDYEDELVGFDFAGHLDSAFKAADYVFQSLTPPRKSA